MENNYNEEKFDSFLNKTIILSSKKYFKKQMKIINTENTIMDNENFYTFLESHICPNNPFYSIDRIECTLQFKSALKSLSAIEQSVLFLLFQKDFSQDEAAKILEICSKSVSRIKLRAISKLRKNMKGDLENET